MLRLASAFAFPTIRDISFVNRRAAAYEQSSNTYIHDIEALCLISLPFLNCTHIKWLKEKIENRSLPVKVPKWFDFNHCLCNKYQNGLNLMLTVS